MTSLQPSLPPRPPNTQPEGAERQELSQRSRRAAGIVLNKLEFSPIWIIGKIRQTASLKSAMELF